MNKKYNIRKELKQSLLKLFNKQNYYAWELQKIIHYLCNLNKIKIH